jgi:hypothetical protein
MLLTRNAAMIVPLAVLVNEILGKLFFRTPLVRPMGSLTPFFLASCGAFAILGLWAFFEASFVHYEREVNYTSLLGAIFQSQPIEPLVNNFFKSLLYFICGPLNPAVVILLAMFAAKPKEVLSERAFRFFLLVSLSGAALWVITVVPTVPDTPFLNRYLAPYIILPQLVMLRMRGRFCGQSRGACFIIVILIMIGGAPANLAAPFADALTPFMASTKFIGDIDVIKNMVFAVIMLTMILLWMIPWNAARAALIALWLGLNVVCVSATGVFWNEGYGRTPRTEGKCAKLINHIARQADAYYDTDTDVHRCAAVNLVRLFVTRPIEPCKRQDLKSVANRLGRNVVFVTDKSFDGLTELCRDAFWKTDVYVYLVCPDESG